MFRSIIEIYRKAQAASLAVYQGRSNDARDIMFKGRYY